MKNDLIYTKKIETGRCIITLYWKESPEFKLIKIDLFDKAKLNFDENKFSDNCYKEHEKIKELEDSIVNYFKNKKSLKLNLQDFDFSKCTRFSKKVLTTLAKIPYGSITTYKRLAELSGYSGACRAVGAVMAKNPFPLLIPCHRVIKSDLCIGEFGPGSDLKRALLCHETSENVFVGSKLKDKNFLM